MATSTQVTVQFDSVVDFTMDYISVLSSRKLQLLPASCFAYL